MTGRVEVVGRVSGRRSWSDEEKLEILAEAFRPGVRVRDVLERRELSSGLVYTWRKQARLGKLGGVVPALPTFAEVHGPRLPHLYRSRQCPRPAYLYRVVGRRAGERGRLGGRRRTGAGAVGAEVSPAPLPTRVFLACGVTDMRKGFDGLAVLVQQVLAENPHSGALFAFRGKRGHLVKLLWFDGQGLCLFSKRLDRGRFVWPVTATGTVTLTQAQLSMLLEGIDWRRPERTFAPTLAG